MTQDPKPPMSPDAVEDDADLSQVRSGERFDGGTDEDEHAGAGFGEGDDAERARREHPVPD